MTSSILYNQFITTEIDMSPFSEIPENKDFQKISENYYLVNQMSIPENKDFFKTLFSMDIEIEKSITEKIELSHPNRLNYFFIKFNNPEEET